MALIKNMSYSLKNFQMSPNLPESNARALTRYFFLCPQYQTVIFTLPVEGGLQASLFAGAWLMAGGWISIIQTVVAQDQGIAGLCCTAQH